MNSRDKARAAAWRVSAQQGIQLRSDLAEVGAYINNQLAAILLVLGELPRQTPEHQGAITDALECVSNVNRTLDVLITGVEGNNPA